MDSLLEKQRCMGVAQVVEPNMAGPRRLDDGEP